MDLEPLPELPTDYQIRDVPYEFDRTGLITKFDDKSGSVINKIPSFFAVLFFFSKLRDRVVAHYFFNPSGVFPHRAGEIGPSTVDKYDAFVDDGGGPNHSAYIVVADRNIRNKPEPRWRSLPTSDPAKEKDYYGLYNKIKARRRINETLLKDLDREIGVKNGEKTKLISIGGREELSSLETSIAALYHRLIPDGPATNPNTQLSEIERYDPDAKDVLDTLNNLMGWEELYGSSAITRLKGEFRSRERGVADKNDRGAELRHARSRHDLIFQDCLPEIGLSGAITFNGMEAIRSDILRLFGTVRDFDSEIEVIGFLNSELSSIKSRYDRAMEMRNLPDEYADLRHQLINEAASLENRIANFQCDLRDLELQLNDLNRKLKQREALDAYERNPGFRGVYYRASICSKPGGIRSRWGGNKDFVGGPCGR